MIPSVNKDERIGDLRLRRLMLNADVSAVATTSRNGLQRRSKVRVNRSAETKYRNVVLIVREEHTHRYYKGAAPLIPRRFASQRTG